MLLQAAELGIHHTTTLSVQPSSPNSFVNLSCTSRSDLLTVGLCLARTLQKSILEIGGGIICINMISLNFQSFLHWYEHAVEFQYSTNIRKVQTRNAYIKACLLHSKQQSTKITKLHKKGKFVKIILYQSFGSVQSQNIL